MLPSICRRSAAVRCQVGATVVLGALLAAMATTAGAVTSTTFADGIVTLLQNNVDQIKTMKAVVIQDAALNVPAGAGPTQSAQSWSLDWNFPKESMTLNYIDPVASTIKPTSAMTQDSLNVAYFSGFPLYV